MSILVHFAALDRGWEMGPDLFLEMSNQTTMEEMFRKISEEKDIPVHLIVMKIPPTKVLSWDGGKVSDKADWTLKRLGVHQKMVITLEPAFPLAWLWEPMDFYEQAYINDLREAIEQSPEGTLSLQELAKATTKPPPIFLTLRVFIMKFPEIFHIEINCNTDMYIVSMNKTGTRLLSLF